MKTIENTKRLAGLTIFITGASRGIGKAIALKAARDGANIVIAAKTAEPHPKLAGTIYTAAKEIEEAGGKALPCIVDVRDENQVKAAVKSAVDKFGGIDILINNASAISITSTLQTDMKRYDLMHNINTRGTFLVSKECLPYLLKSKHPHILNLSPPLNLAKHWFAKHVAYTMAKYGMSMCVLGMAEEFKHQGIAVNALWPKIPVYTAATEMLRGANSHLFLRNADIMSDAAYHILCQDPKTITGQFFIDEDVLHLAGIKNFEHYACVPENNDKLSLDIFLDPPQSTVAQQTDSLGTIDGLIKSVSVLLTKEIVDRAKAVFVFNVTGTEAGTWFLDLKNGSGQFGNGKPLTRPDVVLTMDSEHLVDMFNGKLKAIPAFMAGKVKISGDLQKALLLETLLAPLKAKL